MILLCPTLIVSKRFVRPPDAIEEKLTAMLHDLYFDSRLVLAPDVQEQAFFPSSVRTRRIVSEYLCTNHFCLMGRDVYVGLCMD